MPLTNELTFDEIKSECNYLNRMQFLLGFYEDGARNASKYGDRMLWLQNQNDWLEAVRRCNQLMGDNQHSTAMFAGNRRIVYLYVAYARILHTFPLATRFYEEQNSPQRLWARLRRHVILKPIAMYWFGIGVEANEARNIAEGGHVEEAIREFGGVFVHVDKKQKCE